MNSKLKRVVDELRLSDIDLSDDQAIYDFIDSMNLQFEYIDEDVDPMEEFFVDVMEELCKGEAGML